MEGMAERIEGLLRKIYNELLQSGDVNTDFEAWIDGVVREEEVENQDSHEL